MDTDQGKIGTIKALENNQAVVDAIAYGYAMAADLYNGTVTKENFATVGANSCASANHAGPSEIAPTLSESLKVRRLTPVECERLQGFPDNYTKIPYRGKPADKCPDSPRYKAIGNSWAVPCVKWIGERIKRELENTNN